jgi:hypothetical protein
MPENAGKAAGLLPIGGIPYPLFPGAKVKKPGLPGRAFGMKGRRGRQEIDKRY